MKCIIILGKAFSGKSTFAKQIMFEKGESTVIEVGQIVRQLTQQQERVHDKSLDKQIIDQLIEDIDYYDHTVIVGIRQLSILQAITTHLEYSFQEFEVVYLSVDREQLLDRFNKRQDKKDDRLTLDQVLQRDSDLGLGQIEQYIEINPHLFKIQKN